MLLEEEQNNYEIKKKKQPQKQESVQIRFLVDCLLP